MRKICLVVLCIGAVVRGVSAAEKPVNPEKGTVLNFKIDGTTRFSKDEMGACTPLTQQFNLNNNQSVTYRLVNAGDTLSKYISETYGFYTLYAAQFIMDYNNSVLNGDQSREIKPPSQSAGFIYRIDNISSIGGSARPSQYIMLPHTIMRKPVVDYVKPASATGSTIVISGSGSVFPVAVASAMCYFLAPTVGIRRVPDFSGLILIRGPGTYEGTEEFCAGNADIVMASDYIRPEVWKKAGCSNTSKSSNLEIYKFTIARDAVVVIANRRNPAFSPAATDQSGTLSSFDLEKGRLCAFFNQSSPSGMHRYLQTVDSGTLRFFASFCSQGSNDEEKVDRSVKAIITAEPYLDNKSTDCEYISRTENYDLITKCVAVDPLGIAVVPFAFYANYAVQMPDLLILAPDGNKPEGRLVANSTYPLTRNLYMYSSETKLRQTDVFNFINFTVNSMPALLERYRYFLPPADEVKKGTDTLQQIQIHQ